MCRDFPQEVSQFVFTISICTNSNQYGTSNVCSLIDYQFSFQYVLDKLLHFLKFGHLLEKLPQTETQFKDSVIIDAHNMHLIIQFIRAYIW